MIRLLALVAAALLALCSPAWAQDPPAAPMRIALWANGAPGLEGRRTIP